MGPQHKAGSVIKSSLSSCGLKLGGSFGCTPISLLQCLDATVNLAATKDDKARMQMSLLPVKGSSM